MIDTSDGFVGDLGHICMGSGVGAVLNRERLPVSESLRQAAERLGTDPYDLILRESDDYELIITCPSQHVDNIRAALLQLSDLRLSDVGWITGTAGSMRLELPDGTQRDILPSGWDHFAK
jgi:thiamine-monophosphate kinase